MLTKRSLLRRVFCTVTALTAWTLIGNSSAWAQSATSNKLAPDLLPLTTANASNLPPLAWAKNLSGVVHVKVLISASGSDATLGNLRQSVLASGGSVLYNYISMRALSAMVPASALLPLTSRSDVVSISPNRTASRSASLLQAATGAQPVLPMLSGGGSLWLNAPDGTGVGIAVLDSGIDFRHSNMRGANGQTRVRAVVDFVRLSREASGDGWGKGIDVSASVRASLDGVQYKAGLAKYLPTQKVPDAYGHGSHVAAVAGGRSVFQIPDSGGIAPGADIYDLRVLDERGVGTLADVLAGIEWVIQRSRLTNIRVMNLSLGAASNESFLTDPLARAARGATAAGIVVVAAAGNAGTNATGQTVYGSISSPGIEPSVITVGASNMLGTAGRNDDVVTRFSSRGPTRGGLALASGRRWTDNLAKPDLVAPGNRIVAVLGTDSDGLQTGWNYLARNNPQLTRVPGALQLPRMTLMELSGTSVAAPAVAGAAALLLQANPGLTPPLVKAILQFTAQPLASANLLEQGTGLLNIEGAVRLAQSLRTDLSSALAAGTLQAGDSILAPGRSLPTHASTLSGQHVSWSGLVGAGGTHLVGGDALFTRWQPIYDPGLVWARQVVLRNTVYWQPA